MFDEFGVNKDKPNPNIFEIKANIESKSVMEVSHETPSTFTVSRASMTKSIEYEKMDLGFLFEINFKLFLKEKTNHASVLCINNKHQVIQSKSTALFKEFLEEVISRRWLLIYYFCIRFFFDNILVIYFQIKKPALLSNFITLCVVYELQVFHERVKKTQKYFTDLSSENRVYLKLKEFFGHERFNYQSSDGINPAGSRLSTTLNEIENNAHGRFAARRNSLKARQAIDLESKQYINKDPFVELASRSLGVANKPQTPRNIAELPSSVVGDKVTSSTDKMSTSGVGSLFKGFRTRKILPKAIIGQDEKHRLTQLALDALQLNGATSSAGGTTKSDNGNHSLNGDNRYQQQQSEPTTPKKTASTDPNDSVVVSPSKTLNFQSPIVSPIKPPNGTVATTTTIPSSESTSTSTNGISETEIAKLKSEFPFTWNKAAFDPHVFYNFEFEDLESSARDIFRDRSYAHTFKVRGPTYFIDQQKTDPGPAMMKLMLMELYEVEPKDIDRHDHIASRGLGQERVQVLRNLPGNPFIFVVNFQVAGDPPVSLVSYFAMPPDVYERYPGIDTENCLKLFKEFINMPTTEKDRLSLWGLSEKTAEDNAGLGFEGSDNASSMGGYDNDINSTSSSMHQRPTVSAPTTAGSVWGYNDINWPDGTEPGTYPTADFKNLRFKLVPLITEGPWVVRTAVPAKPVLLGKKLVIRHFRGEGYAETDVQIGSSNVASQITGLCRGYAKNFAADLAIILEPQSEAELPEKLLACVGINKIDVDLRRKLD